MGVPSETVEAIARGFFQETWKYGFQQVDYLRFVNLLLDLSMKNGNQEPKPNSSTTLYHVESPVNLPLIGERVEVRSFRNKANRGLLKKWVKDEAGRYFLLSRVTAHEFNVDGILRGSDSVVGLITLRDSTPVGLVAYLNWDRAQRKAELRKLIGEKEHRGKGLAKEATVLWIRYGISKLGLRKVYLNTLDTNLRNIRLNEELGFKVEGILRNECFFDNAYHDVLRMALLRE